jgi:hypothetical protein
MSNKKTTMLTPQQKADQLINKFLFVNSESVELVTGECDVIFSLNKSDAIECALIHVNELIAEMRDNELNFQIKTPHGVFVYWDVVKHEIKQKQ